MDQQAGIQQGKYSLNSYAACLTLVDTLRRCAMMAGGVTNLYISDFLKRTLPSAYALKLLCALTPDDARAGAPKVFTLAGPNRAIPVFFYGISPSKDQGRGDDLATEVAKHVTLLKDLGF